MNHLCRALLLAAFMSHAVRAQSPSEQLSRISEAIGSRTVPRSPAMEPWEYRGVRKAPMDIAWDISKVQPDSQAHRVRNGAILGAAVGVLAGGLLGYNVPLACQVTSQSTCPGTGAQLRWALVYGALGGLGGGIIGALIGKLLP
jgi:hypothetical protein